MGPPTGSDTGNAPVGGDPSGEIPPVGIVIALSEERRTASHAHAAGWFDACSKWLELAVRYASDAQVAKLSRIAAWEGTEESAKQAALEWEFEAAMQTVMACGASIDALESVIQTRFPLPRLPADKLRSNSNQQHLRLAELLQKAFSLKPRAADALRQNLGEILRFRSLAVDTTGKDTALILHPELGTGVEWRFAYFRCDNALLILRASSRLIWEIAVFCKPRDAELQSYLDALRPRVETIPGCEAYRTWRPSSDEEAMRHPTSANFVPDMLLQAGWR